MAELAGAGYTDTPVAHHIAPGGRYPAIETILRWAGLANDWYVEEVECGSVTGTFDCAFAIRSAETI